jgi:hypothetical protein
MVEAGQLRRWSKSSAVAAERDRLFLVLELNQEQTRETNPSAWYYLIGEDRDWHFENVIENQSEVVDG